MQKHNTMQAAPDSLSLIESLTGITSSKANDIASHYRKLGGYQIAIKEHQFRSDIQVFKLPDNNLKTTYRAVQS